MLKKKLASFYFKTLIIIFFFILSCDFIYSNLSKNFYSFDFDDPVSRIYKNFRPNLKEIYISPVYGKTIFCTDNNGFRNNCTNSKEKKFDYLLIGNIFTEGAELPFEDTFVGQIKDNSSLKFANLGNRNLDMYGINRKLSDIIKNNHVEFKEVILFVGPRFFKKDSNSKNLIIQKKNQIDFKKFINKNFYILNKSYHWFLFQTNKTKIWAYSKNNHYTSNIDITSSFKHNLNNIFLELKQNDKKLSIVTYPYPYHFLYKDFNNEHIYYLEDFCKNKCNFFIDIYPEFYSKIKEENIWKFIEKIYLTYSVHFNKYGNQIIAETVIKNLR